MMCSMLLMKSAERSGQEIVEPIDKEMFQLIAKQINELIYQDELIVLCDQGNRIKLFPSWTEYCNYPNLHYM